jgi:hypothetical protein
MKHIRLYEEQDITKSDDMICAVVHIFAYGHDMYIDDYYACVSPTIWDIAGAILEDFTDPDEIEESIEGMTSIYDIQDILYNSLNDVDELDITIWTGLTPRSMEEKFKGLSGRNPYELIENLDSVFTDCKKVMTSNSSGSNDSALFVDMIATSIKNSPEKIQMYIDSPEFNRIVGKLGWPDDKIKAVLKYSDIKKQI